MEATKEGIGFIELKEGNYNLLSKDVEIYESNKEREFADNERDIDTAIHNFEVRQRHNIGNNVNVGNRGKRVQNVKVSEGKSDSNRTANTQASNGNLDEKSFSLKGTNDLSIKGRKELIGIIDHLKGEFEVTKFAKSDPKKLAKMTRDILKEYDSQVVFFNNEIVQECVNNFV